MAQLYYRYGTMNSGKSIEILKVAHNYEEQGKPVVLMTSATAARDGYGVIASRMGLERRAVPVTADMDIIGFIRGLENRPYCVLIDECQFLSKKNVYDLAKVVDDLGIPVMCFGLKNDFRNQLFPGSYHLLCMADKIEEIKTICQWCSHKATMVLRTANGRPVYEGAQVQLGGNETYIPVCRKHWFHPRLREDGTVLTSAAGAAAVARQTVAEENSRPEVRISGDQDSGA